MQSTTKTEAKKDSNMEVNPTLPFTLKFEPADLAPGVKLPLLQSYVGTVTKDGCLLLLGGRSQGLHTFKGGRDNFDAEQSNNQIYVIDPANGQFWSFDVNQLSASLAAPLQSTDQQGCYERVTDTMYIVGGYGWNADRSDMKTFGCIISVQVEALATAIRESASVQEVESLFKMSEDDRFAITGGELIKMEDTFYLVGGQIFNGQYSAFGGADFYQVYSNEVRIFTLANDSLEILNYGVTRPQEPDAPLHRRDGNIIPDIDPITGTQRITCYGGVFPPGIIGGYTYPVFIYGPSLLLYERSARQKFSQYQCPVISVYDENADGNRTHHTFFGGISHHYYSQTTEQKKIFEEAIQQGRNDGLPFIADISTFTQSSDGTYAEFLHKEPIPGNELAGTSCHFMGLPELYNQGMVFDNDVIRLSKIPTENQILIGYIYGGIVAEAPYPKIPNEGTAASNNLYKVYLSRQPEEVLPADLGHVAH